MRQFGAARAHGGAWNRVTYLHRDAAAPGLAPLSAALVVDEGVLDVSIPREVFLYARRGDPRRCSKTTPGSRRRPT